MFFKKIRKFILDILFPIECLGCQKEDVWLCDECLDKLSLNNADLEQIDLKPSYLDGFFIASDWENKILQEAIHKFKYNFAQELAEPLSKLMIKRWYNMVETPSFVHWTNFSIASQNLVIIPIPLHKKRYIWRGFNQAELLAEKIAKEFDLKLDNKLLKRIKNTSPQVKLKSEQRGKNIADAFELNRRNAPWRVHSNILLIDDVITTGATMNECAKVLKDNGVEKVYGLALARG